MNETLMRVSTLIEGHAMETCVHQKAPGNSESKIKNGTLGTFVGVFTPSILTLLGIILFLRLGYVTGSAGLVNTLIIIGTANIITILTSFSLSAIATNLKIGVVFFQLTCL